MNIRTLTVVSAAKLPHPNADFASISSGVEITAELAEGDVPAVCAKKLQAIADNLVEQHIGTIAERARQRKPQAATENKAVELAAKHRICTCTVRGVICLWCRGKETREQ